VFIFFCVWVAYILGTNARLAEELWCLLDWLVLGCNSKDCNIKSKAAENRNKLLGVEPLFLEPLVG